jgi:Molecular chaperone (small heat shock protein)
MRPFAEMDEMFEHFDHPLGEFEKGDWMPAVDIEEDDKSYMVRAELPGVHKDDVHVTIENNVLTIKGEKKLKLKTQKDTVWNVRMVLSLEVLLCLKPLNNQYQS